MLKKIQALLKKTPKLMAKHLAAKLNLDKTEVNKILYANKDLFNQNTEYQWSAIDADELIVEFQECSWMSTEIFEKSLSGLMVLDGNHSKVKFVVAKDCKILLEALARLLALCNQLNFVGKKVTIDFSSCTKSIGYFNRIGFFD